INDDCCSRSSALGYETWMRDAGVVPTKVIHASGMLWSRSPTPRSETMSMFTDAGGRDGSPLETTVTPPPSQIALASMIMPSTTEGGAVTEFATATTRTAAHRDANIASQ